METENDDLRGKPADSFIAVRRKVILLGVLFFLGGFIAGTLFGIFGMRHIMFRFRPAPEKIAMERAREIQKNLGLSDAATEAIQKENLSHFFEIRGEFDSMRSRMDVLMTKYAENVAKLIDDPDKKKMWLATYRDYFPKGPPPPPPPGPHR